MKNPHDILDEVIPLEKFSNYLYIRKPARYFFKRGRFLRLFQSFFWNVYVLLFLIVNILCYNNRLFLVREYDFFSLLLLFLPLKADVVFNVNHNLASRKGVLITRMLMLRYKVMMLDASDEMKSRHPSLLCYNSNCDFRGTNKLKRKIVVFLGSRLEQKDYDETAISKVVSKLESLGLEVICCGRNYGNENFIKDEEFDEVLYGSIGLVLFSRHYQYRHSGSVWTIAQKCSSVIIPNNDVFKNQCSINPRLNIFKSLNEVEHIVQQIFKTVKSS